MRDGTEPPPQDPRRHLRLEDSAKESNLSEVPGTEAAAASASSEKDARHAQAAQTLASQASRHPSRDSAYTVLSTGDSRHVSQGSLQASTSLASGVGSSTLQAEATTSTLPFISDQSEEDGDGASESGDLAPIPELRRLTLQDKAVSADSVRDVLAAAQGSRVPEGAKSAPAALAVTSTLDIDDKKEGARSRMQEKNRRAQKRFRERQKTKFAELTAKVQLLESQLHTSAGQKGHLKDQVLVLEKVLEMRNSAMSTSHAGQSLRGLAGGDLEQGLAGPIAQLALSYCKEDALEGPAEQHASLFAEDLALSVPWCGRNSLTPADIAQWTALDLVGMYELYIEALKVALQQPGVEDPASLACAQMTRLLSEVFAILLRVLALKPVMFRELHMKVNNNRDQDPVARQGALQIAASLDLSGPQQARLIDTVATYFAKVAELNEARQGLLRDAMGPLEIIHAPTACDYFLRMAYLQQALSHNMRQEHWESVRFLEVCHSIMSPLQAARFMVASHPYWFDYPLLAGVLCSSTHQAMGAGLDRGLMQS